MCGTGPWSFQSNSQNLHNCGEWQGISREFSEIRPNKYWMMLVIPDQSLDLSLDSAPVEISPPGIKVPAAILGWRNLASNCESAMDQYLPSFRLEFPGTYNEYRIVDGHVQFRPQEGHWRTMDVEDIRMHFALRTPVASWIRSNTSQTHNLALAM